MLKYILLTLILTFANDFFNIFPLDIIPGINDISDLGLPLIFLGIAYYVLANNRLEHLVSFFSFWVFCYLILVLTQVSIASINYSQSVLDGLIISRLQFYYLSFFLFVIALDSTKKIKIMINIFTVIAISLIVLSLINYFGFKIFDHRLAEGHGERAGVIRAFVPGMEILVCAALWHFWKYINEEKIITNSLLIFSFIYGGIVFRQTRGHLIAVSFTILIMLFLKKKFKLLIGFSVMTMAILVVFIYTNPEENLLINAFETTYTDLTRGEGTWAGRLQQFEDSWKVFVDNFFTGSGGLLIRGNWQDWEAKSIVAAAYRADLGYWVWLKAFGLPGIILLTLMIVVFYRKVWITLKNASDQEHWQITAFVGFYFMCILISLVTLTYLTRPRGIVLICLSWAMLTNLTTGINNNTKVNYNKVEKLVKQNNI